MKLTSLRLTGFKSFVEPTELTIEPGLTGVVGPNGCGKSNLLEALRWVMGESSPKSMRGSGMEDVIFAGTAGRPARNTAEVTVQIDNSARLAPAQMNESDSLEISRRIERDAGSVYRINGKDVRQRDVQILFADASTGAHSPALVRQGRISELINMKPKARRAILEEAAGISGLHARRHEAELRLRAAENNLERLNDVIQEIETQLAGLKRQARQASRYRNLSGEIRRTEAMVLHLRWTQAEAHQTETKTKLSEVTAALAQATQEVARLTSLREEQAEGIPERREAEAEAAAALQRLKHEQEALAQEEARAVRLAQDIRARIDQFIADLSREEALVREADETVARLTEESTSLTSDVDGEAARQEEAEQSSQAAAAKLATSEANLDERTQALSRRDSERGRLDRELRDLQGRLERLEKDSQRLAEERNSLAPSPEDEARLAGARAQLATTETDLTNAEQSVGAAEEARVKAQSEERAAREPLQEADKKLSGLKAEINALTRLLAADKADLWPPLIDAMQVQPGFEIALGAVLGDELNAPADEAAPVHWRPLDQYAHPQSLPMGVRSLGEFVSGPSELQRSLSQIGLVETVDDGQRLHADLLPGQRLVTREGDLWRWDGYRVSAESPSPAAQRLEQHNRLKELTGVCEQEEQETARLRTNYHNARSAAEAASESESKARAAVRTAQNALNQSRDSLASIERNLSQSANKLSALEERVRRNNQDTEEAQERLKAAQQSRADLGDDAEERNAVASLREQVSSERLAASEARAQAQTLRRETQLKQERIERLKSDVKSWLERSENSKKQTSSLTERIEAAKAELSEAEATPVRIEEQRSGLLDKLTERESVRKEAADRLALAESALKSAETHLREADKRLSELREQRARLEAQLESAQEKSEEVVQSIRESLECEPEAAFALTEHSENKPLPELSASESRLERLRRERENLGGVNLRADEEAAEAQERMDNLINEKTDLEAAIAKLRGGINSLNKEGRERILAAFDVVNGHFSRLFTRLFNGGEARLELVESDDPLEAGLEIFARPPGKKLATMSLMSGGEQTLTAMALIFAVFLSNPSPICVLDEVDAPLDDSNTERFCTLLNEMTKSSDTRFLIITHHPLTMARMDRLYGVTMAERGISQLVSVDLTAAAAMQAAG